MERFCPHFIAKILPFPRPNADEPTDRRNKEKRLQHTFVLLAVADFYFFPKFPNPITVRHIYPRTMWGSQKLSLRWPGLLGRLLGEGGAAALDPLGVGGVVPCWPVVVRVAPGRRDRPRIRRSQSRSESLIATLTRIHNPNSNQKHTPDPNNCRILIPSSFYRSSSDSTIPIVSIKKTMTLITATIHFCAISLVGFNQKRRGPQSYLCNIVGLGSGGVPLELSEPFSNCNPPTQTVLHVHQTVLESFWWTTPGDAATSVPRDSPPIGFRILIRTHNPNTHHNHGPDPNPNHNSVLVISSD